jgi:hypothetical protein
MPASQRGLPEHARAMVVGLILGLASVAFTALLSESQAFVYLGILLGGIGFVYAGFAVADGRPSAIAVNVAATAVFLSLGFLGAHHRSQLVLGLGFLAHAAWDWLHHDHHGPTQVRTWYPPFCAVADAVIGLPLIVGWM